MTETTSLTSKQNETALSPWTHELKTWPFAFQAIVDDAKRFEVRKEDRDYRAGDYLLLREWDPQTGRYTGADTIKRVTYIMRGGHFGIEDGYCVMSIDPVSYAELRGEDA